MPLLLLYLEAVLGESNRLTWTDGEVYSKAGVLIAVSPPVHATVSLNADSFW